MSEKQRKELEIDRAERALRKHSAGVMPIDYYAMMLTLEMKCSLDEGRDLVSAVLARQSKRKKAQGTVTYADVHRSTEGLAWKVSR
jgi:hypothetical protein